MNVLAASSAKPESSPKANLARLVHRDSYDEAVGLAA